MARPGPSKVASIPVSGQLDESAAVAINHRTRDGIVTIEEAVPSSIAEKGGLFCRADDVGKENGRQRPIQFDRRRTSGEERLDVIDELYTWFCEDRDIFTRYEDAVSIRDSLGKVAPHSPQNSFLTEQNECRSPDSFEGASSIHLHDLLEVRDGLTWPTRHASGFGDPATEVWILSDDRKGSDVRPLCSTPDASKPGGESIDVRPPTLELIVNPDPRYPRVGQNQGRRPLWMCCREERGDGTTVQDTQDRCVATSDFVQDSGGVVGPLLPRG
jgi:hypothetical protein